MTVLVVAHLVGIRHLLSAVLEDVGLHVLTADNSEDALDIVERERLRLIVTDVPRPNVDGRDFFRTLAQRGSTVPIVIMASSNAAEVAQRVGAAGYLDKPFSVYQARATLVAALQEIGADAPSIVKKEQEQALRAFVYTSQPFLAKMITLTLDHGVFVTRAGHSVTEAAAIIRDWRPQLVVVDLDTGGNKLLGQLAHDRAAGALPLPMIAVTRNRDLRTKIAAFEQGVDDVLTIPVSPEELVVRVHAMMRRTYGQTFPLKPVVLHQDLQIDIANHHVRVGASEVHLTDTEQSLLYLLAANSGETVTADEIMTAVCGVDDTAEKDVVERLVASLRDKLKNGWTEPRFITTYPGVGYCFLPVAEQPMALSKSGSLTPRS